ncbi:hypothetical protein M8J75_011094 [Diaphorina citri]|nr:hypothetical protein M8J75_011094 [Diaphorina citri]
MENQPLIDLSPVAQTDAIVQPPMDQGATPTPPVEASAASTGAASGGDREAETAAPAQTVQRIASCINRTHLDRPKLSGAQRRKLQAQRAIARGEPVPPRKRHSVCNKGPGGSSVPPTFSATETPRKRGRSALSTPSTGEKVPMKKNRKGSEGGSSSAGSEGPEDPAVGGAATFSQALTSTKMAIVPIRYPEEKMVQSCADTIGSYLCRPIFKAAGGDSLPTFVKNDFEKGALVLVCRDEFTRLWLENTVKEIPSVLGIHVKVGPYKELIPEHKAIFMVSKRTSNMVGTEDPKELISLVGLQNPKLDAENIGLISVQKDVKGMTLVVSLDEKSLKGVRESGFKISLGLEMIPIRVPEEKRSVKPDGGTGPNKPPTL